MEVRKNTAGKTMGSTDYHQHHDRPNFWLPSDDSPLTSSLSQTHHFAQLTRRLARYSLQEHKESWRFPASPQWVGPWSGSSRMPPGTAKSDVDWELLYEAAGQVARLKMEAMTAKLNLHRRQQQNRGILPAQNSSVYDFPKRHGREEWNCRHQSPTSGALSLPQSDWPPSREVAHHPRQQSVVRGGFDKRVGFIGSGSGQTAAPPVKRQSTGTGVFIPQSQRVGSQPDPYRKKPTGRSTVQLPARGVQALNLDLEEINNGVKHNTHSRFDYGFLTDHDVLIARRNAIVSQENPPNMKAEGGATMVGSHHIRLLPTDWTY